MQKNTHYNELGDIPLYNYLKLLDGDYTYSRIDLSIGDSEKDYEAFEKIYNEYIASFGLGRNYSLYLDKLEELTIAQCEFIVSGNKFLKNEIRVLENELKEFKSEDKTNIEESLLICSKHQGYPVRVKEISAKEFFSLVKLMKNEQRAS